MKRLSRKLRDEKGIAIPFVAVALIAIMALTAVGVETGRLATVATEVQTAADIAATAGAMQLVEEPNSSPRDHAEDLLIQNLIDGNAVNGGYLTELDVGNYTGATGFIANLAPMNAVRAQVEYTVNNTLLTFLGMPTSHVTKVAVAAFNPATGGRPTIPIAVGECLLNEGCLEESCQPTLTQIPSPEDNSAWTGFFDASSSTSDVGVYFPSECPGTGNAGSEGSPWINVGDTINLINGQSTPLLNQIQCMLNNGLTEVLVPIVTCDQQFNQGREVLGFARFEIVSVRTSGSNKGITIQGLVSANDAPGGEAGTFGAGAITMVE